MNKKQLYVHVPFATVDENLPYALNNSLCPEFAFNGDLLDRLIPEELESAAAALSLNSATCTIHAPFMDLNPGSTERLIREATEKRFRQVISAAEILKPRIIVFHPGYDRWRYGENQLAWLTNSLDIWRWVLERAEQIGFTVAIENIFEEEPSTLKSLIEVVNSPRFRHCFDVGHWNMFKQVSMTEWFAELGEYVAEVHIHDNFGEKDDHLPVGEGAIDFDLYFNLMAKYAPDAVWTIETHSRERVSRAVKALEEKIQSAGR